MITVEERITYLDNIMAELARAQVQNEIASKATDAQLKAFIAEMRESRKSREEDRRQREEDRRQREEDWKKWEEDRRQREEDTRRMQEDTRRMKQAWGDLANKMGTVAEDVVAPNIPRLAIEEFGFGEVEDLMVRACRASRRGEKRRREWDVVCSGPEKVIVVEVKSTPSVANIREVPDRLAEFFDFFPEYEGRALIGIFASWAIRPELLPVISETGLYGLAMGEDTMEIVARPALEGH